MSNSAVATIEEVEEVEAAAAEEALKSHLATLPTISARIRYLRHEVGMQRGEVAKLLNVRYQHVRNVELQLLKRVQ